MAEITPNKGTSTSLNRHILALLEPTIKLDEIKFDSYGEEKGANQLSKEHGSYVPFVKINGINIMPMDINSFTLSLNGFLPTCSISFVDSSHMFSADAIPRDGDVMSIRIAAKQNDSFKDIRCDFLITRASNKEAETYTPPFTRKSFTMQGILKIPGLNIEECISYKADTTDNHLKEIAKTLQLGYATNVDATNDKMTRVCPYISRMKFIEDMISHSYIDDKSFQIGFVDPYYYLNFVDLNKLFNSKNEMEETLMHLFNVDRSLGGDTTEDMQKIKGKMVLTNHSNFGGSSQFIESNSLINNSGGISFANGTKRTLQFFENDSDENLVTFDIEPLASDKMRDNEEPLKGRRGEDDWKKEVRQKYVGRIDVDAEHGNMHLNYYTSSISNNINKSEIYKMGLNITLPTPNLGLYRGMKIPVLIFSKDASESMAMKNTKDVMAKNGFDTLGKEIFNENIDKENPYIDKEVLDEFKSGYYIIDEIIYTFDKSAPSQFIQKIKLLRREWPTKARFVNPEVMEAEPTPAPTPPKPAPVTPPPAPEPEPVAPPEPEPTPKPEPKFTLNVKDFGGGGMNGLGSWFELKNTVLWKADDNTLVTETPKIKAVFKGPLAYEVEAVVAMEEKEKGDSPWNKVKYNAEFTVPKDTFKDKEGKYDVDIILTYKNQTVTETAKFEWWAWKPDTLVDQGGIRVGKLAYSWQVVYGEESGTFVGKYTLKSEATKSYEGPKNGKVEGTDVQDVINRTQAAMKTEYSS